MSREGEVKNALHAVWDAEKRLGELLKKADTLDKVKALLVTEERIGSGEAFWIGDGDDLWAVLYEAGWRTWRYNAQYYWVVCKGDDFISYTEGDVDFSDNYMCGPIIQ